MVYDINLKQDVILFFPFSIDIYKEKFLLDLITVFYLLSPKKNATNKTEQTLQLRHLSCRQQCSSISNSINAIRRN